MPDPPPKDRPDFDQAKFHAHLTRTVQSPRCPLCGEHRFVVVDFAARLDKYWAAEIRIGGQVMPVVFVMCSNCKALYPFAAIPLGLVSQGGSAEGAQGQEPAP